MEAGNLGEKGNLRVLIAESHDRLDEVASLCDQVGREGAGVNLIKSSSLGHFGEILKSLAGDAENRRLIIAGGDGTIHQAVRILHQNDLLSQIELALLPIGTGNDLARSLGLITNDLALCFKVALNNKAASLDLISSNLGVFVNSCSLGAGAEITASTDRGRKDSLGRFAYFLSGIRAVGNIEPIEAKIRGENFSWEGEFIGAAFMNGRTASGGLPVAPEARLNDGLIDLAFIRAPLGEHERKAAEVMDSRLLEIEPLLVREQSSWFHLTSEAVIAVNLDGEPFEASELKLEIHERAVSLVVGDDFPT